MIEHYERFDLKPEIFGDVCARFKTLHQAFLRLLNYGGSKG
jgi:hypothetical protein